MKDNHRTPSEEVIAARMPTAIAEEIKRAAHADDRTVSAWLRRHFIKMFAKPVCSVKKRVNQDRARGD
jgi:hypothetical protein